MNTMHVTDTFVDDITHTFLYKLKGVGITLDPNLACDLNDHIAKFLTENCKIEVSSTDQ